MNIEITISGLLGDCVLMLLCTFPTSSHCTGIASLRCTVQNHNNATYIASRAEQRAPSMQYRDAHIKQNF